MQISRRAAFVPGEPRQVQRVVGPKVHETLSHGTGVYHVKLNGDMHVFAVVVFVLLPSS